MTKKLDPKDWALQTKLVRGGLKRSEFKETSEALFLTSGFVYDSAEEAEARFKNEAPGYTYSRFDNPTVDMFETRMAILEGAERGIATATGMAAVFASLMCFLRAGDHIVSAKALFGSCRYIVETVAPQFGITSTLVDGGDVDAWRSAIRPQTKAFFLETPSNPMLSIVDLAAVCAMAREIGARVIVDNVFATPVLQRPGDFGADIVVYSATKHIDGQGRCLGGIILGSNEYVDTVLRPFTRNTGPSLSPFNAWVLLKGLETLDIRVKAHCDNTERVADFLAQHPKIERVIYPGRKDHPQHELAMRQMTRGGNLVAFVVRGGRAGAFACANALEIVDISNNLGDARSLITHPATTTHMRLTPEARAELGITEGLLRLSVGLEDAEDICRDLDQALAAVV